MNPNCKQRGHSIENCYWQGGGKKGQFPPGFGRHGGEGSNTPTTNSIVAVTNVSTEMSYVLAVITELPPDDLPATGVFLTMLTQSRIVVISYILDS